MCTRTQNPPPFRFNARWLTYPDVLVLIKENWGTGNNGDLNDFVGKLNKLREFLDEWGKREFKNNQRKINKLVMKVQNCLNSDWTYATTREVADLKIRINELWEQEELYWVQKVRVEWLKCGDKNTKFFHMLTIKRRCRNKITRVRGNNNEWLEEEKAIGDHMADYYSSLFTTVGGRDFTIALECVEEVISSEDNLALMAEINNEEVKQVVYQLGRPKAPGPDGFTGWFY